MIEIASKEKQLKNLEDVISHSKPIAEKAWMAIAEALHKINMGNLFLPKYRNFDAYCLQKWGFKRRYQQQLRATYLALKDSKIMQRTAPPSAAAATEIGKVPEEQREEVLEEAKKSGKVTQKSVKEAAKKTTKPKPKPEKEKDKNGYPIPERLMPIWNRRNEVRDKLQWLSELKQWATDMQGTDDIFWLVRGFKFNNLITEIEALHFRLQLIVPDVVCTACQGEGNETCDLCFGRGMIPLSLARQVTPIEMKKIRDRMSANDSAERLSSAGR